MTPTPHGPSLARERAFPGAPAVVLAVERAENLPVKTSPAPGPLVPGCQEPAAFYHK